MVCVQSAATREMCECPDHAIASHGKAQDSVRAVKSLGSKEGLGDWNPPCSNQ